MRKPMMAGNWKMNKTVAEAVALAEAIRDRTSQYQNVDRVICPPFVCLPGVSAAVSGSPITVGAQTMHWEESGAFTGEISPTMLAGLAQYVIIGHSERRAYYAESDEAVNQKVHAALNHGLTPILCVGESLEQNQAGETHGFVSGQVTAALAGLSATQVEQVIIAYEPIWAIGTGLAATAEQANAICGVTVRATVAELYDESTAQNTRVLYGGSTKPGNIAEIMGQVDIDGALIGGAALTADSYSEMVRITSEVTS